MQKISDHIGEILERLPEAPGVYEFLGEQGEVLYVGKSKCLRRRVHSYFAPNPAWEKAKRMVPRIRDIRITVTATHLEAMLLECEKIKRILPYYNTMMKHDRSYVYLTLETDARRKPLKITAGREELSFGPFRRKRRLEETMDALRNLYPIVRSENGYAFEYHIFPAELSKESFAENRRALEAIFSSGKETALFCSALRLLMSEAVEREQYERALKYRDLTENLRQVSKQLARYQSWMGETLIYGVPAQGGYRLFLIQEGQVAGIETAPDFSAQTRSAFVNRVLLEQKQQGGACRQDDKELLDYRDVLWTELSGADPELVVYTGKEL